MGKRKDPLGGQGRLSELSGCAHVAPQSIPYVPVRLGCTRPDACGEPSLPPEELYSFAGQGGISELSGGSVV